MIKQIEKLKDIKGAESGHKYTHKKVAYYGVSTHKTLERKSKQKKEPYSSTVVIQVGI